MRDPDFFNPHPTRTWYPLRSEKLELFDCVKRSMVKELTYKVQSCMVSDVYSWFFTKGLAVQILWRSSISG